MGNCIISTKNKTYIGYRRLYQSSIGVEVTYTTTERCVIIFRSNDANNVIIDGVVKYVGPVGSDNYWAYITILDSGHTVQGYVQEGFVAYKI